ncbi:MAG: type II toxin-antitoxin system antitoxin SocA domain-containing protein [Bacteroidales bacterium]
MFDSALFTENELNILESITRKFYNSSAKEIIDISHEESTWNENEKDRKIIDYNYAFDTTCR